MARELADDTDLLAADETRKQLLFRAGRLAELVLILSAELKSTTEQLEDLSLDVEAAGNRAAARTARESNTTEGEKGR